MSKQGAVHVFVGSLILIGLALGFWVSRWWLLVPAFVGANLFQWGLTGFCPAEKVFGWMGLGEGSCGNAAPPERSKS